MSARSAARGRLGGGDPGADGRWGAQRETSQWAVGDSEQAGEDEGVVENRRRFHDGDCTHIGCSYTEDEADLFAPQMPKSPEAQRSYAAMDTLARRDRVKGLGATFLTQRPAKIAKDVLVITQFL